MKYGIIQHLKYILNYRKTVVHLQADLKYLPFIKDFEPFYVKEIDINNKVEELKNWVEIVNDAYDDIVFDVTSAKKHINEHLFLNITNIYFVKDGNNPIATISIGTYKNNYKIGGDARIAVKKSHQGMGLGEKLILFGFNKLKEKGIKYGESIISIPRKKSLMLHFKCGFFPQYCRKYVQYKKQKRFFVIRLLVNENVRLLYRQYRIGLFNKIISKD